VTCDPYFKATPFFEVEYQKNDGLKYKVTIAKEESIPTYGMVQHCYGDLDSQKRCILWTLSVFRVSVAPGKVSAAELIDRMRKKFRI